MQVSSSATMSTRLDRIQVRPDCPLRQAMRVMDRAALGIVLVTDAERNLIGTITDGDVRRAILGDRGLDLTAGRFVAEKRNPLYPRPVWAPAGTDRSSLLRLMQERTLHHLPLLDEGGRLVDLVTLDDLIEPSPPPARRKHGVPSTKAVRALIMAGGLGTRLGKLTETTPKPMLPVGGRPLLERTLARLRDAGIRDVSVSTFFEADKLVEHFKDGRDFGVDLNYVNENRPMGTAGALGLLDVPDAPLLVMNGDILTSVDFRAMLQFHRDHGATLTLAVRKYEFAVPYGVVECDDVRVRHLTEKPVYSSFVNAGIYLLEPAAFDHVPRPPHALPDGARFNMTDLIQRLIDDGHTVVGFPIHEYWLDIGQAADYERAEIDVREGVAGHCEARQPSAG